MDKETVFILTEIIFYVIIVIFVIMIAPTFLIYPGLYYGRWKTNGPTFKFETPGGIQLEGVHYEKKGKGLVSTDAVILYFHGNNLNVGSRARFFTEMRDTLGVSIIAIDYRGFGNSRGFPSETGLVEDAQTIWNMLKNDNRFIGHKKIVMGKSLGGAVTTSLAKENDDIDGIILENTFTSIYDVAIYQYSFVGKIPEFFRNMLLLGNRWESIDKIEYIKIPKLFISGQEDKIVNPKNMNELYTAAPQPKQMLTLPEGKHTNSHKHDNYYQTIAGFINGISTGP